MSVQLPRPERPLQNSAQALSRVKSRKEYRRCSLQGYRQVRSNQSWGKSCLNLCGKASPEKSQQPSFHGHFVMAGCHSSRLTRRGAARRGANFSARRLNSPLTLWFVSYLQMMHVCKWSRIKSFYGASSFCYITMPHSAKQWVAAQPRVA